MPVVPVGLPGDGRSVLLLLLLQLQLLLILPTLPYPLPFLTQPYTTRPPRAMPVLYRAWWWWEKAGCMEAVKWWGVRYPTLLLLLLLHTINS